MNNLLCLGSLTSWCMRLSAADCSWASLSFLQEDFTNQLHSIGYPQATEENGLLLQLKAMPVAWWEELPNRYF